MQHQAWVLLVSYVLFLSTSSIAQAATTPGSSQAIRSQGLPRRARPDNNLHAASLLALRDSNASLLLVARQQLFDYATTEGLDLLQHIISQLAVPTYSKKIHVPVLGSSQPCPLSKSPTSPPTSPPDLTTNQRTPGPTHLTTHSPHTSGFCHQASHSVGV
jgi:hypothetical protein